MTKWIERLSSLNKRIAFLGPLLGRIAIGIVFVATGWGKLHSLDNVTSFFMELGVPAPAFNAVLVASTEFFGGLALIFGLGARLAAIPMAITMIVALFTAKREEIDGVVALVNQVEAIYLVIFAWIATTGAGAASLDHLIAWAWRRRHQRAAIADALHATAAATA